MCVTVLQGTSTRLYMQMNRVPLPATMFYVSLYRFCLFCFFVFSLCFLILFTFDLLSLFSLLTLLIMHLDQYIF